MIEEHASVADSGAGYARVLTRRRASCARCSAAQGCGRAALAQWFGATIPVEVRDPLGVSPGERVIVGLDEQVLLRASLAVYGVPLGAMLMLALAAELFIGNEVITVVAAVAGFAAGLIQARLWAHRPDQARQLRPVILRRASAHERTLHPWPEAST